VAFFFIFAKTSFMQVNPWLVGIFAVVIFTMLLIDLGLVNKKSHQITNKEALRWTLIWISLSMGFSAVVWWQLGFTKFAEYQSAYWIEEALSVDNMFVFILVFKFFKLDGVLQHRVLFWGIIGALIFRAIFIFSGIGLIKMTYLPAFELFGYQFSLDQGAHPQPGFFFRPNLILTIFGAFLIYAGIKSLFDSDDDDQKDYSKSLGARMVRKIFPVTKHYYGDRFFVKRGTKRLATKLFLVLVVIETTDLIFAIDSIPAIFAIAPNDPLILYTSNIFAVLGLRSMYFLLANSIHMFSKLKYGLAFILSFIGVKMLLAPFFHIESAVSLSIVLGALLLSVCASIIWREESEEQTA
jgi:tellurite resistance protein TerC